MPGRVDQKHWKLISLQAFNLPCYFTVPFYVVIHFCDSILYVCLLFFGLLFKEKWICIFFVVCLYLFYSVIKEALVRIPLTGLTTPLIYVCPKLQGPGFSTSYVSLFNDLKWEVIARFIDWWNCWPSLLKFSLHNMGVHF